MLLLHLLPSFHLLALLCTVTTRLNVGFRHIHSVKTLICVLVGALADVGATQAEVVMFLGTWEGWCSPNP